MAAQAHAKTSLTHPLQIAEVRNGDSAALGLTFCPGKKQPHASTGNWDRDLAIDLDRIRAWGARAIVTLMPQVELDAVKVGDIGERCEERGMEWYHLPIVDVQAPDAHFERRWLYAGLRLRRHLQCNRRVLIHCRGGLGRTGTVAARLLVELGASADNAIAQVRSARPGAIETAEQEAYVRRCGTSQINESLVERLLGCLMGGAVGDAFGYAVEFDSLEKIRAKFGPKGLVSPVLNDGRLVVSDDTQMTMFTVEAMLRACNEDGAASVNDLVNQARRAYMDWLITQGGMPKRHKPAGWLYKRASVCHTRAPGNTCLAATQAGATGTTRKPINNSKGCGAAMRTAPLGFLGGGMRNDAQNVGEAVGALTHGHPDGWAPAGAVSGIVWGLVRGWSAPQAAREVASHLHSLIRNNPVDPSMTVARLELALELSKKMRTQPVRAIRMLGQGWSGDEALAIAIYCALTGKGYEDVIRRAANHDGDSDSTASIAGQIYGAWRGVTAIPHAQVRRLDVIEELLELAAGVATWPVHSHPITLNDGIISPFGHETYIRNVMEMVHVLHRRGYQRMRICCGRSHSDCYYHVIITPADNFSSDDGSLPIKWEAEAQFTSIMGNQYFGWRDATDDGPEALAEKFVERFRELSERSRGRDWRYAGWYAEMLGFVERGHLPCAFSEHCEESSPGTMHVFPDLPRGEALAAPPGGEGLALARTTDQPHQDAQFFLYLAEGIAEATAVEDLDMPPPTSYQMADGEQRVLALKSFYYHGVEHLLPFVQHVWGQLADPRTLRCEIAASKVGIIASGKNALRKLLEKFLSDADAAVTAAQDAHTETPKLADFDNDIEAFTDAYSALFATYDAAAEKVARTYAAVIGGESP